MNGTLIRASDDCKLICSALDVSGSRFVVNRPIKAPLTGEGSVRSDLDTVKPLHSIQVSLNRWYVYVKVLQGGLRPPPLMMLLGRSVAL